MTRRDGASAPPGYERARVGGMEVVALASALSPVLLAIREGSLYEFARKASSRVMEGRGPVYVATLPGAGPTVAVRHSRRGGLLAPVTGDRFAGSTRAPHELAMSLRLSALGIRTPRLVAYVLYPAGPLLRRSDVATHYLDRSVDLAGVVSGATPGIDRGHAIASAATLLVSMARAGVRHPDLNLKNILIAATADGRLEAYLLDVDRVRIESARARAAVLNAARLTRSARRWRERKAASFTDAEIATLEAAALGQAT